MLIAFAPHCNDGRRMADRRRTARDVQARTGADREVPVPTSIEVTVEQATKRLRRLSPDKLRRVRAYERQHLNRQTVLAAIDALLLAGEFR
jgi:hypothetical protein